MRKLVFYRNKFDFSKARDFRVPSELFTVTAPDGVTVVGSRLEGPAALCFLVVHGLMAHHRAPGFQEFAESLSRHGTVFTIDLRGHGFSTGASTLGNKEALDVAAAVRKIRSEVPAPLYVVGFSMGAAAAVRSAALHEPVEGLIAVSGPAIWHGPRRWAARRTALMWKLPGAPTLVRFLTGVRIDPNWTRSEHPADVIANVHPAPVLIVHGEADQFFPPSEARRLFQGAGEPKDLWMIESGGHAEGLFMSPGTPPHRAEVDEFVDALLERFDKLRAEQATWQG